MANENTPLRIGLTGGIASGKSAVADLFAALGVVVIDTDVIAREVVESGTKGLEAIRAAFGDEILNSDGTLDRAALRSLAFADNHNREKLETILHPLIRAETLSRSEAHVDTPYQILVVPLLLESGFAELVDRILVVDCPVETQIERLIARDGSSRETATAIINAQISREERLAVADDVILNDGSPEALNPAVATLHRKYLQLAASASS